MRRATKEMVKRTLCRFCSWRLIAKCPKIKECVQRFAGNNSRPIFDCIPDSTEFPFSVEYIPSMKLYTKKDRDIASGMLLLYGSELY